VPGILRGDPRRAPAVSAPAGPLFRSKPVIALAVLAAVSAAVTIGLFAFGSSVLEPAGSEPTSFGYGALGQRAAYAYLESIGIRATRSRGQKLADLGPQVALLIVDPPTREERPDAAEALVQLVAEARRHGAPTIVFLPKWDGVPSSRNADWIAGADARPLPRVSELARAVLDCPVAANPVSRAASRKAYPFRATWRENYDVSLAPRQLLADRAEYEAVVQNFEGVLVAKARRPEGAPPVFVVSDPDIVSNHGLAEADHATLLRELVTTLAGARAVVFDETLHGYAMGGRLAADALRPPAVFVTAHVLLLIGCAVWAGTVRSAPARPTRAPGSIGREEFIASTVRLLGGASGGGASLADYFRLAQEAVADALRLPSLPPPERLKRLAAATTERGVAEDLVSLDAAIEAHAALRDDPGRREALARRVYLWRKEMTVGTR